ncbi:hypothetical protein IFR05_010791 [Cadophora sp. M221]|nr:hypothetical protein IFR05_010791 [Cadophora sp. M221]
MTRYGQSKLANILHAKELNSIYGPNGSLKSQEEIWSMSLHAGVVYTDLAKKTTFAGPLTPYLGIMLNFLGMYIPANKGANTSVFCAASDGSRSEMSGEYFVPYEKVGKSSKNVRDMVMPEKLWKWIEEEFKERKLL